MGHTIRLAVSISIVAALLMPLCAAAYYVDSQNGSDSRSGTSDATSWQSLAKVNGATFQASTSPRHPISKFAITA